MCDARPKTNGSQSCPAAPGVSLTEALKGPAEDPSCRRTRHGIGVCSGRKMGGEQCESSFPG